MSGAWVLLIGNYPPDRQEIRAYRRQVTIG
jgi:hypothetical protein